MSIASSSGIDGCKLMCAAKMVRQCGGTVEGGAVLDVYRRHKDLKPEGIAELNYAGQQLARVLAEELTEKIDELAPPNTHRGKGGSHG